jgi:hypothetical protein
VPTITRVVFGDLPQPQRDEELRRIFGTPLRIEVLAGQNNPGEIVKHAQEHHAIGVVLEVAPTGSIERLRIELPKTPLLRPIKETTEARNRDGRKITVDRWAGYGLLNEQGDIENIPDRGLDPSRH